GVQFGDESVRAIHEEGEWFTGVPRAVHMPRRNPCSVRIVEQRHSRLPVRAVLMAHVLVGRGYQISFGKHRGRSKGTMSKVASAPPSIPIQPSRLVHVISAQP